MFALNRKSDLLWWSQARYSLSFKMGFADIPKLAVPFFLACDVQLFAPNVCPQSVDHFLAHVVRGAVPKPEKATVREVIDTLLADAFRPLVIEAVTNVPIVSGRCGLLSLLKESLHDRACLNDLEKRLAVGSTKVSLPVLAQRVLWELKVANFAISAGATHG